MSQYQFLSDDWMNETRRIREEYKGRLPEVAVTVRMNQVINSVPFGDGVLHAHVDTSSGQVEVEPGHLDSPDLTVTLDYATAKAILVDGDAAAAMNAFMGGKIKVDGDITKMLALQAAGQSSATNPAAVEMVKRIQEITA